MQARVVLAFLSFGMVNANTALAQSAGTFTAAADMTVPRAGHTATLLLNGKVLIAGGFSSSAFAEPAASAELFDSSTGTFTTTGNMITARRGHTATLLADGRVLISGGFGISIANAELYDPESGTFIPAGDSGDVNAEGIRSQAVLLADGKVLLAGTSFARVFDPASSTLFDTGAYTHNAAMYVNTATLLPQGSVLLTGCLLGRNGCSAGVTQLYDPGSGTFSATVPMQGWSNETTATLLMNGKVLFAGNAENDGTPADAEEYDPSTGTFTPLGNTIGPHDFSASTLIPDGTVLITGGQLPRGRGDHGAEIYDPAGKFTFVGAMITGRHSHTATLLPDGAVLIAGGFSGWPSPTSRAEIYRPAVLAPPPALLSLSQDGKRQGAILHAGTAQVASSANPTTGGEILEVYCTGLPSGSAIPPQVSIGGRLADVLFFGDAP